MILTKKKEKITLKELLKYDFKHSTIQSCEINNKKLDFTKYKPIIFYLYRILNNTDLIFENTNLNIKSEKKEDKGFDYLEELNISIQGVDSNKAIKEIYNMSKLGNIEINIKIKLENDKIVTL